MKKALWMMMVTVLVATAVSFAASRWLVTRTAADRVTIPTLHDLAWLERELDLTADQVAALEPEAAGLSRRFDELCAAHCEARIELGRELAKPAPDIERCRRSVEAMNRAQAAAERATLEHILEVRAELTDQQARQYGRLVCDQVCSMNPSSVN